MPTSVPYSMNKIPTLMSKELLLQFLKSIVKVACIHFYALASFSKKMGFFVVPLDIYTYIFSL